MLFSHHSLPMMANPQQQNHQNTFETAGGTTLQNTGRWREEDQRGKGQLTQWVRQHGLYPSREQKERLARQMGTSYERVNRLLANQRRRQHKRQPDKENNCLAQGICHPAIAQTGIAGGGGKEFATAIGGHVDPQQNIPRPGSLDCWPQLLMAQPNNVQHQQLVAPSVLFPAHHQLPSCSPSLLLSQLAQQVQRQQMALMEAAIRREVLQLLSASQSRPPSLQVLAPASLGQQTLSSSTVECPADPVLRQKALECWPWEDLELVEKQIATEHNELSAAEAEAVAVLAGFARGR